jgi:uncharacterized UBP type Zn finger protein
MLENNPSSITYLYLQEIIKTKFVDNVRKNISISSDIINEIRLSAYNCGWLNTNKDDEMIMSLLEQQDVSVFYDFLLTKFNCSLINIKKETIGDKIYKSETSQYPFINLDLLDEPDEISIKSLVNSWSNIKLNKTNGLCATSNHILNIPNFLAFSINRFSNSENGRVCRKVDIQKKIKLSHGEGALNDIKWQIHSIVCHRGDSATSGHYYALLHHSNNKWYLFDDKSVPSLHEVKLDDDQLIETIKTECVFLIYKHENSINK